MFMLILALILWVISLALLAVGKVEWEKGRYVSLRPWSFIPFGLAVLILFLGSYAIVKPGNVAVPVAFGKAGGATGAGFHLKPPWTKYHTMTVKVQNYTMSSVAQEGQEQRDDSVPVAAKDQVTVRVDSTALFRLTESKARDVFVDLGSDYVNDIVRPAIRTAIRDKATPYNAIDLATTNREQYQLGVETEVEEVLGKYGIQLVALQIRDIHLPEAIQQAVNAKAKAQQDVERQGFILQSKKQQQQQRIVDAEGLAKAQTIIHSTLTPEYLKYLYISELGKLAQSKNTTFLFLPSDPDALPNFQIPLTVK